MVLDSCPKMLLNSWGRGAKRGFSRICENLKGIVWKNLLRPPTTSDLGTPLSRTCGRLWWQVVTYCLQSGLEHYNRLGYQSEPVESHYRECVKSKSWSSSLTLSLIISVTLGRYYRFSNITCAFDWAKVAWPNVNPPVDLFFWSSIVHVCLPLMDIINIKY